MKIRTRKIDLRSMALKLANLKQIACIVNQERTNVRRVRWQFPDLRHSAMYAFKNRFKSQITIAEFVTQESLTMKNFASAAYIHRRSSISVRFKINQDINKW